MVDGHFVRVAAVCLKTSLLSSAAEKRWDRTHVGYYRSLLRKNTKGSVIPFPSHTKTDSTVACLVMRKVLLLSIVSHVVYRCCCWRVHLPNVKKAYSFLCIVHWIRTLLKRTCIHTKNLQEKDSTCMIESRRERESLNGEKSSSLLQSP